MWVARCIASQAVMSHKVNTISTTLTQFRR